jgi:hypothetical protein
MLSFSSVVYAQKTDKDSLCLCSKMIELKSYYWKLDSLASNGYRLCSSDELLKCQLDNINLDFLIKYFGRANTVSKSNNGIEYIYYYFDYRKIPKDVKSTAAIYYVSFFLKNEKQNVERITSGHYD